MAEIKGNDPFINGDDKPSRERWLGVIKAKINSDYTVNDKFVPAEGAHDVHTTPELVELLKRNDKVEIDARVICKEKGSKRYGYKKLDRGGFLETWKSGNRRKFKEDDLFGMDGFNNVNPNQIGVDFVPLLGGPFYKQLYYYDYLRMHGLAYFSYNHHPAARRIIHTIRDFTLGRGWRANVKGPNEAKERFALAVWRAFEEANDLYNLIDMFAVEYGTYGESMIWELPDNQSKIVYRLDPDQIPKALIPRYRLIDPSVIWEIVTYPEDITRVLYYQWVAPTQYQIYTGQDKGKNVPGSKFIFQQVPADQVLHFKTNAVSNEKRGRSDLFPILGFLKRLTDSVDYSIVAMQKNAAWAIDTTIEGNQTDIDNYIADQNSLGQYAPAGSEFVHTSKVKRQYMGNETKGGGGGSGQSAFDWCMNMIAMGSGIPVSYFGTSAHAGSTRAGALVATEPVAKMFEKRQFVYESVLKKIAQRVFAKFGLDDCEIEVTFPEIIVQDRSAKLADLQLAEEMQWISKEKAATIAAKELGITEYEYDAEQQTINGEMPTKSPLSQPGKVGVYSTLPEPPAPTGGAKPDDEPTPADSRPSAVTSADRRQISMNR